MISSLQALRFIFALFIFFQHFPIRNEEPRALLDGAGYMGVSFFLVLSGFVMSLGYAEKVKGPDFKWGTFMKKRLVRLWPLHLLCLAIWMIFAYGQWGKEALQPLPLVGNALLLQAWFPIKEMEGNGVAWCLSDLILFYGLFPFLMRMKPKNLGVTLLSLIVMCWGLYYALPISDDLLFWYWYKFPISRLCDFILGILSYHIYQYVSQEYFHRIWGGVSPVKRRLMELASLLLYALAFAYIDSGRGGIHPSVYYYLPSCLVIFIFALADKSKDKAGVPALISQRWLIYLGEVSFSFYMIHNLVILFCKKVFDIASLSTPWQIRFAVTLPVAIAISILVNKYYEEPITAWLSKRLFRKEAK